MPAAAPAQRPARGTACSPPVSPSPLLPPWHQHHLACTAVAQEADRIFDLLHWHDVRDRGTDVEAAGAQQVVHLVPRLIHAPADDAVDRDPLEDHEPVPVQLEGLLGEPEEREPTAV